MLFQVGYREGITAGKESALQEGFDAGFANVGAPLGRELGLLRGMSSVLVSWLSSMPAAESIANWESLLVEARGIASQLANIRLTDIAPRDTEAEDHAKQHLELEGSEMEINDELSEKRKMEGIEDMMAQLTAGTSSVDASTEKMRPTAEDLLELKERLYNLFRALNLSVNWS